MASMNVGRVVGGGLLAGLIINISEYVLNDPILGEKWEAASAAMNSPTPDTATLAFYSICGFVLGLVAVWLYATMRPRLGAGPKSAIIAGLIVWLLYYGLVYLGLGIHGIFAWDIAGVVLGWSLVEMMIASVVGCAIYKEAE
ncbi:MAG: hypothetical protein IH984_16870 [Planctomycetes bacterium]|nr:hypothetical protein [Planctomycetota bacterium]